MEAFSAIDVRHRTVCHLPRQRRAPALGRAHGAHRHDARVRCGAAAASCDLRPTRGIGAFFRRRRHHRPSAKLDRDHDAARLVCGARPDCAAAGARGRARRRRRLDGHRAGLLVRREMAMDRAGRHRRAGVHARPKPTRPRRRAHLHRLGLDAARAGAHLPCRRAARKLSAVQARCLPALPASRCSAFSPRWRCPGCAFEPLDRAAGDVACGRRRPARAACALRWCSARTSAARSPHSPHPVGLPPAGRRVALGNLVDAGRAGAARSCSW